MTFGKYYNNWAKWEGGCLYSGSHATSSTQGYFLTNPAFSGNSAPYGLDDIWVWLQVTVSLDNVPTGMPSQAPTNVPTAPTSEPTSSMYRKLFYCILN